jgi:hypothetical protein
MNDKVRQQYLAAQRAKSMSLFIIAVCVTGILVIVSWILIGAIF